ncbi:hypothetical protein [Mycolicibacterium sp. 120270]|uniref:hypothetical protein n=1 Tax=Mycolicibacterium sp. 120270 TaxID=3090600 RepID=UPI00299E8AC8|nr:hypothetical protein [Mycolicibacterium sp. 120270]MDX1884540.1 hypothetical protein [Mycolicibacterium sp. 120270]
MGEPAGMGAAARAVVDAAAAGSVAALHGSAASRMLQSEWRGGLALPAGEFVAAVAELAAVDGSLGWPVAMVNAAAYEVDTLYPNAADDVWSADPHALIVTSYQAGGRLRDGVLTGRWKAVVGAEFADWLLLSVRDAAASRVLVPRGTASIDPLDSLTGLHAAGICDVTVSALPVDDGRIFAWRNYDDVAMVAGAGITAAVVGAADGVWRRHVDQLRELLATSHGGQQVTDEASAQLGRAASDIDAAALQIRTAIQRRDDNAAATRAYRQAVERARGAADRILGSSRNALEASSPVSCQWRDVHAGCRLAAQLLDGLALD